jgi:O-antigen ligase
MTALAVDQISGQRTIRSPAVLMLQVFAFTVMVFPSDTVVKAIGAGGYVAALVAYLMLLSYIAVTLFGLHNPLDYRSPVRIALCTLWLSSLASYALMDRTLLSSSQQSSADRWLIQLAGVSGVILVASEFLPSLEDIHRVLRALAWGGAICGVVAALQFWLTRDITPYLRILPGFRLNSTSAIAIGSRGGLNRVAGTAGDPIVLGVVAGMLLPLAIYLAMHDKERSATKRWFPVICITIAIPTAVSRAAILSVAISLGVLVICLPSARRLTAIASIPVVVAGFFLTAHRLLGTLEQYFFLGTNDNSISHRVGNYSYAEDLIRQALWFGRGGGTYIAIASTDLGAGHILDNQYLDAAVELGLVGVVMIVFYFLWPALAAFAARNRSNDPRVRDLCAALGGAGLAAVACSATFDAFGFPMFVMVEALVVGLIGAVWLLVEREQTSRVVRSSSQYGGTARMHLIAGPEPAELSGGN